MYPGDVRIHAAALKCPDVFHGICPMGDRYPINIGAVQCGEKFTFSRMI